MSDKNLVFENGYALLIGLRYQHWQNKGLMRNVLSGDKDVKALATHFTHPKKAAYKPENVISLVEEQATAAGILNGFDQLIEKVKDNDDATVVIYYAGHGETNGTDYFLVPYDFDLKSYRETKGKQYKPAEVVLAKQFVEKIQQIQAKKMLIMLDCCHSENIPMERSLLENPNFLNPFLNQVGNALGKGETQVRSLVEKLDAGSGKVILTSCKANQTSIDLGVNGLFTTVLLECLSGKDNNKKDGLVRLTDMMDYIPPTVEKRARENHHGHIQHPIFKSIENFGYEPFIICAYDIATANLRQNTQREYKDEQQISILRGKPVNSTITTKMPQITILHDAQDEAYLNILLQNLESFERRDTITIWTKRAIRGGENYRTKTEEAIANASQVVVLLSASFLSSKGNELLNYTEQAKQQGKPIIPILIRPCLYEFEPTFQDVQILPANREPISKWESKQEAWMEIVRELVQPTKSNNGQSNRNTNTLNTNNRSNQTSKEEILQLIESDLDEALEKLDAHFGRNNGTYNDLANEYFEQPNNFSKANYRRRLRRFVQRNM